MDMIKLLEEALSEPPPTTKKTPEYDPDEEFVQRCIEEHGYNPLLINDEKLMRIPHDKT